MFTPVHTQGKMHIICNITFPDYDRSCEILILLSTNSFNYKSYHLYNYLCNYSVCMHVICTVCTFWILQSKLVTVMITWGCFIALWYQQLVNTTQWHRRRGGQGVRAPSLSCFCESHILWIQWWMLAREHCFTSRKVFKTVYKRSRPSCSKSSMRVVCVEVCKHLRKYQKHWKILY